MLPLKKWSAKRVYGKILAGTISTIIYPSMRKVLLNSNLALTEFPRLRSL